MQEFTGMSCSTPDVKTVFPWDPPKHPWEASLMLNRGLKLWIKHCALIKTSSKALAISNVPTVQLVCPGDHKTSHQALHPLLVLKSKIQSLDAEAEKNFPLGANWQECNRMHIRHIRICIRLQKIHRKNMQESSRIQIKSVQQFNIVITE